MLIKARLTLCSLLAAALLVNASPIDAAPQSIGAAIVALNQDGVNDGILFTGQGTVTVADGQNINQNGNAIGINPNGVNDRGTVTFLGASTVSGDIRGSAFETVRRINIESNKTLTLSGFFYIENVHFSADGSINMPSDAIFSVGGIDTAVDNTGSLILESGHAVQAAFKSLGGSDKWLKTLDGSGTQHEVDFTDNEAYVHTIYIGGTALVDSNVTADTIYLSHNALFEQHSGYTVTANIVTDINNTGRLSLQNGTYNVGQIGSSALRLLSVDVAGGVGDSFSFNGDVYASSFNLTNDEVVLLANGTDVFAPIKAVTNNAGTVTFQGNSSTGGAIGSTANFLKEVSVGDGSTGGIVTLNNNIRALNTNVRSGAALELSGNRSITGALAILNGGTLDVQQNTLNVSTTANFGAGSDLRVAVTSSTASGSVASSGVATVSNNSAIDVDVRGFVPNASTYTVVNGTGGAAVQVPATIRDNSAVLSFTGAVTDGGADLTLTATRSETYHGVATSSNASKTGAVLDSVAASQPSGDMRTVIGALDSLSTPAQVEQALQSISPVHDQASIDMSHQSLDRSLAALTSHLDSSRGVSTGDPFQGADVWTKEFGVEIKQASRGDVEGYAAEVLGTELGTDWPINESTRLGIAGAFARSNIDSDSGNTGTDIDSFQGTVYTSSDFGWHYLDATLSFAQNNYKGLRHIAFSDIDRIAAAEYGGCQYSALLSGGRPLRSGEITVTPLYSLLYAHLDLDSYDETGAGALSLSVNDQSYDSLHSGLGMMLARRGKTAWGSVSFEAHAKWLHDFIGDRQQSTSTFSGGGASFDVSGPAPIKSSADVGFGFEIISSNDITISLNYDHEWKTGFQGDTGSATFKISL